MSQEKSCSQDCLRMTLIPSGGTESHILFLDMCNEVADLPSGYRTHAGTSFRFADGTASACHEVVTARITVNNWLAPRGLR
jgi:hypothetical protein